MRKTLTYSSFIISSLVVAAIFVTARNYTQLVAATILYPILVYFAFKVFPRKNSEVGSQEPTVAARPVSVVSVPKESSGIADFDKRGFLKMIGAAGLSFFLFSIFSRRANVPFFGKLEGPVTTSLEDARGNKINPAQSQATDGYKISEVDDGLVTFYGFINNHGAWFIMREDTDTGSFRYTRGDTGFADNWPSRENLKYDYYFNVF